MEEKLSPHAGENISRLKESVGGSADFYSKKLEIQGVPCAVCLFDGIASTEKLWVMLLEYLAEVEGPKPSGEALLRYIFTRTDLPVEPQMAATYPDAMNRLTAGFALLFIEGCSRAICLATQSMTHRAVQEPSGEGNIRGSREGFTDLVRVNMGLLRRLMRGGGLNMEILQLGERTKTEVALCYSPLHAPHRLVDQVRRRLQKARLPVLFDSSYLTPYLQKRRWSLFQGVGYTERPVTACAKLCEGKVVLLVNGSPFALILPYFFAEHFQSLDDYAQKAFFASFLRLLKYGAFFLSILLPGVYVCAAQYAPQILPQALMMKVLGAEQSTPWPLMVEVILVTLMLEIIREAGLRLPKPIGHTVGLFSALLIGDSAVAAGILSTPVLIVTAFTAISMFVLPSLYEQITILRILFLLAGGWFGPVGLSALLMVLILSVCGSGEAEYPFAYPFLPLRRGAVRDGLLRFSWPALNESSYDLKEMEK